MLGGQTILVRGIASYNAQKKIQLIINLIKFMRKWSAIASILISICAIAVGFRFYYGSTLFLPFILGSILVPLMTMMNLQESVLRGLNRVIIGQTNTTLYPLIVIIIVGTIWMNKPKMVNPSIILMCNIVSALILVVLTSILINLFLHSKNLNTQKIDEDFSWKKYMLPFMLIGGMQIINNEAPIILLGSVDHLESVGIFRVAQKGAMLVPFGLLAANVAIAPNVAKFHAKGENEKIQKIVSKSMIGVMIYSFPVAFFLIVGGTDLLTFIFGSAYSSAYRSLIILLIGQLFNAIMGPVGVVLNMIGLERYVVIGVTTAAIVNVILCFSLIPFYGATGAAIASSASLIIWNIMLAFWLYRNTGIICTISLKIRKPYIKK